MKLERKDIFEVVNISAMLLVFVLTLVMYNQVQWNAEINNSVEKILMSSKDNQESQSSIVNNVSNSRRELDELQKEVSAMEKEQKEILGKLSKIETLKKQIEQRKTELKTGNVSRGGDVIRVMGMDGTGYTLSERSCGKKRTHPEYGITRSGVRATAGRTVAVDPRVIPLGTELYISFPEPYEYLNGFYIAEDTGSAVKGRIVDIFFGEDKKGSEKIENAVMEFGRRKIKVYVMEDGSKERAMAEINTLQKQLNTLVASVE